MSISNPFSNPGQGFHPRNVDREDAGFERPADRLLIQLNVGGQASPIDLDDGAGDLPPSGFAYNALTYLWERVHFKISEPRDARVRPGFSSWCGARKRR